MNPRRTTPTGSPHLPQRVTPAWAETQLARADGARYVTAFQFGNLEVEYYRPQQDDPQRPHTRDEVYFVIAGTGVFVQGDRRQPFGPGEVLYVPAGEPHRFEAFSADFATWAVFTDNPSAHGPASPGAPSPAPPGSRTP